MAIYKLPPNSDNGKDQEAQHHPEFIFLDESQEKYEEEQEFSQEHMEYFESLQNLEKARYPWSLRILTCLGSAVLFVASLVILLAVIATWLVSALTLFRIDSLNQLRKNYWKIYLRVVVFTLGLFVATCSPSFGYGIIILYFILQGETVEDHFISRMFKPQNFH